MRSFNFNLPAGRQHLDLGTDFGVRNVSGLWIDLDRSYGFYVFVGETATFARGLRFELEGGLRIQGRYPERASCNEAP